MRIDLPFRVAILLSMPIWVFFLTTWQQWDLASACIGLGAIIFGGAVALNLLGVAIDQISN